MAYSEIDIFLAEQVVINKMRCILTVLSVLVSTETTSSGEVGVLSSPRHIPFSVGERVRVVVSVEELRTMQEGHGGWNHKMAEVCWFKF